MNRFDRWHTLRRACFRPAKSSKGGALLEFCIVLPILVVVAFAIIDFGLLIQARLIITNVSREGGELAARLTSPTTASENSLIDMLQNSGAPLKLNSSGKICITDIAPGSSAANPDPSVSTTACQGGLDVQSGVSGPSLGLTPAVYNLLVYNQSNKAPAIGTGVMVVEVFYKYTPITPLPKLIPGILTKNGTGMIISSRAVFCAVR